MFSSTQVRVNVLGPVVQPTSHFTTISNTKHFMAARYDWRVLNALKLLNQDNHALARLSIVVTELAAGVQPRETCMSASYSAMASRAIRVESMPAGTPQ